MVLSEREREQLLQEMFDRFHVTDFQMRGEVREFVALEPEAQMIWLFLALKTHPVSSLRGHLVTAAYATALAILYAVASWFVGHPIHPPFGGVGGGEG